MPPTRLVSWFLTEGNTYLNFAASPFPLHGKSNASSRSRKKNFWHRCRGDLRQVKTYQVPIIKLSSLALHYRHSPLVFLSPTSKMIFEKICLFRPSFVHPFVFPYVLLGLLARLLGIIVCLLKIRTKMFMDPLIVFY